MCIVFNLDLFPFFFSFSTLILSSILAQFIKQILEDKTLCEISHLEYKNIIIAMVDQASGPPIPTSCFQHWRVRCYREATPGLIGEGENPRDTGGVSSLIVTGFQEANSPASDFCHAKRLREGWLRFMGPRKQPQDLSIPGGSLLGARPSTYPALASLSRSPQVVGHVQDATGLQDLSLLN